MAKWAISGLAYLVVLSVAVRVSANLLGPALPLLVVLLGMAILFRRLWKGY